MQEPTARRGGWLGAGIGYCAWAAALIFAAMLSGAWRLVFEVGVPCILLSIAAWQLTVLATQGGRVIFGATSSEARAILFGSLSCSLGALLFVANDYALPILLEHPGMRRLLAATGSATRLPSILAWLALALGVGLLGLPVRRLLRRHS